MMKLLIVSALLMLLNAQPLPAMNVLSSKSQHLSRALPQQPKRSISFSQLVNGFQVDGIHKDFPQDVLLHIFAHRLMTFEEAKKIALKINANAPESWAIKYHDPTLDKYSIVEQWRRMEDGQAKDQLKEKMMLNPTLKNILEWEGGLDLSYGNLLTAVVKGNLDIVKYLIVCGVKPWVIHLNHAILSDRLDIFKFLVKQAKINIDRSVITNAIRSRNPDIVKSLINDGNFTPKEETISYAISWTASQNRNPDIVRVLVNEGKLIPTEENLTDAIYWNQPAIVRYFIEEVGMAPNEDHLDRAIQGGNPDMIKYVTQHM